MFCGIIEYKRINSPGMNYNIYSYPFYLNMNDYDAIYVFVFLIEVVGSEFSKLMAMYHVYYVY